MSVHSTSARGGQLGFLTVGGPIGALIRSHDWTSNPLGPPASWPSALRSAVSLCLSAVAPTAVYWGPEHRLIFGEHWAPFLGGRGEWALGRAARDVWRDQWELVAAQFEQVRQGRSVQVQEMRFDISEEGLPAERYWTYSLTPVLGDDGTVLGAFNLTSEVTEQVVGRRLQRAMVELGDRFAELPDDVSIVREGCAAIGSALQACRAGRGFVDQAVQTITVGESWQDAGAANLDGVHRLDALVPGLLDELARGEAVVVHDVATDPRTADRAATLFAAGVHALLAVPTVESGRLLRLTFVHADRPRRWGASELSFVRDVVGRGGAATERARAQAALRESELRYRHAVELSPLQMWTAQPDGRLDHVADALAAWTGHAGLGDAWAEVIHPEERARSISAWRHAVATGSAYDIEHRFVMRDGGARWMRSRALPQRDAAGRIVKWYGSTEDIDDAKHAEAALAASEGRLRAIADSVSQMIWSARPDGVHDYYNQTWHDFTGIPRGCGDVEGWHGHPEDEQRARDAWRESLRSGTPYHMEYRLRHRSGTYRWVLARAQAVRDGAGAIERWYGACTDIEEIVAARDVLARSRAELEELVRQAAEDRERIWRLSTELMLVARVDGVVSAINPAWTRLLGWAEEALLGRSMLELVHPDDLDETKGELARLSEGETPVRFDGRFRGADGSYRWLSWTAVPEAGLIHAVARDITAERAAAAELEVAQDVLRQTQKMEAVGQLTGGIAHDFNNMLAVVVGSLDLLGRRLDPADERSRRHVSSAMEGARRAAALTQRLLAFARQQKLSPVTLDVNELLDGMGELLRGSLGAFVRLELAPAPDLWRTLADENQLENAILNLAVNARDAMPQGGTLRITAANDRVGPGRPGVGPGEYVALTIADTGVGMPPEVIARVFDPFFTTKEVGRGTGLGLSQVYGFVQQSGGHVSIASTPGAGTSVTLLLPRADAAALAPDTEPPPPILTPVRGETVLVVEDEPAVRRLSAEAVRELGYRVLEADGAAAALAILDEPGPIELLFTDVVMPDMNGRTLAAEAVRRRPGLRVLFATGYARDQDPPGAWTPAPPGARLLSKPFTVEQLAAELRVVLDAPEVNRIGPLAAAP